MKRVMFSDEKKELSLPFLLLTTRSGSHLTVRFLKNLPAVYLLFVLKTDKEMSGVL